MKQVVQTQRDGNLRVEEVPEPMLRPGGVLVRTAYSLISAGTEGAKVRLARKSLVGKARQRPDQVRQVLDSVKREGVAATYRRVTNKLDALSPLGYSASGVVVAVGAGVDDLEVGDRVACAGGGYAVHAETIFVPRNLCVRAGGAPLDEAAFTTIGAIAMQGVRQAEPRLGETVAVVGLGLIGLITVQLLRAAGCRVVGVDPDVSRHAVARELGCHDVAVPGDAAVDAALACSAGRGVDAAVLTAATASSGPVALAARLCRDRGRVVVVGDVGMELPRAPFYDKELDLRLSRSYGPGRYDPEYEEKGRDYPLGYVRWTERRNMEAFLGLVADGAVRLRPLITLTFPIERAAEAYDVVTGDAPSLGVLLEYPARGAALEPPRERRVWVRPEAPAARAGAEGRVRVGVVGAGGFAGAVLIPLLKAGGLAELRGVAASTGPSARGAAERFGFAYATTDPSEIFADPEVDAVVIATRHDSHAELAAAALGAGKAVFVEKPLALTEAGLARVLEAARAPGAPQLAVGFNRRFAPATLAVRAHFEGRREPIAMRCRVNAGELPPTHWLHDPDVGGGRILGEGCHFVDLLHCIAGAEPVEVFARALPDGGKYRQDNVSAWIRFADGSTATLDYLANGGRGLPKEHVEVFGAARAAVVDDFRTGVLARDGRRRRIGKRLLPAQDKGHAAGLRAFLEAVRGGREAPVALAALEASTRATFALVESIRSGGPVRLERGAVRVRSGEAAVPVSVPGSAGGPGGRGEIPGTGTGPLTGTRTHTDRNPGPLTGTRTRTEDAVEGEG